MGDNGKVAIYTEIIRVRVDGDTFEKIKSIARYYGKKPSTLMREFVTEKVCDFLETHDI